MNSVLPSHYIAMAVTGERKDRDPITACRTEPEFVGDLNGDSSDAEPSILGWRTSSWNFSVGRIDLHDVRCLQGRGPSLAGSKQRAVRGPSEIVEAKANRNAVFLDRRLPARQANEKTGSPIRQHTATNRLSRSPGRSGRGCFATWHGLRSGARVPFPDLTVVLAAPFAFQSPSVRYSVQRTLVSGTIQGFET
jgi:hypothetical protein